MKNILSLIAHEELSTIIVIYYYTQYCAGMEGMYQKNTIHNHYALSAYIPAICSTQRDLMIFMLAWIIFFLSPYSDTYSYYTHKSNRVIGN